MKSFSLWFEIKFVTLLLFWLFEIFPVFWNVCEFNKLLEDEEEFELFIISFSDLSLHLIKQLLSMHQEKEGTTLGAGNQN